LQTLILIRQLQHVVTAFLEFSINILVVFGCITHNYRTIKVWLYCISGGDKENFNLQQVFLGVLGTRFGSLELKIGSLESEKIISGSLGSEKSRHYRSIPGT